MVGHTGNIPKPSVAAVRTPWIECLVAARADDRRRARRSSSRSRRTTGTAEHDARSRRPARSHTAHTTNPVPVPRRRTGRRRTARCGAGGRLCDIVDDPPPVRRTGSRPLDGGGRPPVVLSCGSELTHRSSHDRPAPLPSRPRPSPDSSPPSPRRSERRSSRPPSRRGRTSSRAASTRRSSNGRSEDARVDSARGTCSRPRTTEKTRGTGAARDYLEAAACARSRRQPEVGGLTRGRRVQKGEVLARAPRGATKLPVVNVLATLRGTTDPQRIYVVGGPLRLPQRSRVLDGEERRARRQRRRLRAPRSSSKLCRVLAKSSGSPPRSSSSCYDGEEVKACSVRQVHAEALAADEDVVDRRDDHERHRRQHARHGRGAAIATTCAASATRRGATTRWVAAWHAPRAGPIARSRTSTCG